MHCSVEHAVEEGAKGDGDAGSTDPETGGGADLGVLYHRLVGLYVEDVALLHVVIRGVEDVGIAEVELVDLVLAVVCLAQQLDIVALAVDGHVADHGESLEDGALVAVDGEGAGVLDLAHDGDLEVVDHRVDEVVDTVFDIGGYLRLDGGIGLLDGLAGNVDMTDDGEVDVAIVVDKVFIYMTS